jgi:hypothetical protein
VTIFFNGRVFRMPGTDYVDMYYDRQGKPISPQDWAKSIEEDRRLAYHITKDKKTEVSTVWLGLDHNFFGGPPLIFETMVFVEGEEQECHRYTTEEQAFDGHIDMINKYNAFEQHPSEKTRMRKPPRKKPKPVKKTNRFERIDLE